MISHDFTALPGIPEDEVEVRFEVAFETSPIGIQINAPDGRWLQANDAMCELLGYSLDELRELTIFDITHPTTRRRPASDTQTECRDRRTRTASKSATSEPTGQWSGSRVEHGRPRFCRQAALHDRAHRRHHRAAPCQCRAGGAEERFRRAFDGAPIGMAMAASTGAGCVNRALCELTGYSGSELLERTFQDITHPDDR